MKKILMLCTTSGSVKLFRMGLIKLLLERGHEVSVCAFDEEHAELVRDAGAEFICIENDNRSVNPLSSLTLKKRYTKLIKEKKPDTVMTFMLKPNVFGTVAAKKAGVADVYSMVEGAGDVFINNSLKWKLIRFVVCSLYKKAFKISKKIFFINEDDRADFIKRGLVNGEKCEIVHGVGVNLERFEEKPITDKNTFLMIARLLKTKGVFEYCEAAKTVKERYPNAVFNLIGPEGTVKVDDIKKYTDSGIINYLGYQSDVRPFIEAAAVNVLPSYREGLGLVNAEAGAVGRPTITCNTVGTKDTVEDGYNGFLIPVGDSDALAEKMIFFIKNPNEIDIMGHNARIFAEERFDQKKINEKIYSIISKDQG